MTGSGRVAGVASTRVGKTASISAWLFVFAVGGVLSVTGHTQVTCDSAGEQTCWAGREDTDSADTMSMSAAQRAVGAVVGSLVADAAAAPLHWVYDKKKLDGIVASLDQPEFAPPGHCPFYTIPTGRNSAVGDQTLALLQSLVHTNGFDAADYAKRLKETFGSESDYEVDHTEKPVAGPWRPGHVKSFLENYAAGVIPPGHAGSNGDVHGKLAPVVALLAGQPQLLDTVEQVTRVTHNDDTSVAHAKAAAVVLEQYILHGVTANSADKILTDVIQSLDGAVADSVKEVLDSAKMGHHEAVGKFASHCGYPQSFKCTLHAVVTADLQMFTSVRDTITAGGDNTPRAAFVGACLGTANGVQGIPTNWQQKTLRFTEILDLAEKLVSKRSS